MINKRFGKLIVIGIGEYKNYKQHYICKCDCGNTTTTMGASIISGNTKSCGCLKFASDGDPISKQPEYKVWQGMKGRCNNPNHTDYKNYGARGITVCEQWANSYAQFIKDMGRRPKGLTIERVDNDIGYCPENCIWDTRSNQLRNRRPYTFTRKN